MCIACICVNVFHSIYDKYVCLCVHTICYLQPRDRFSSSFGLQPFTPRGEVPEAEKSGGGSGLKESVEA